MQLCDKLNEKNIFFPLESNNRLDAIEKLLNHLKNNGFLKATEKLFKQIEEHEQIFTSAAGRGVVYPHATSYEIDELVCILGISMNGINFHSPDNQLCHIILLTLSPKEKPVDHRKFITRFRTMIKNPDIRSGLLDITQSRDAIDILHQWDIDQSKNDVL
tara:strand:+ start:2999 stop:3478 length:480 start_codon:yes stop_codon:yes gene_type:complete